MSVPTHRLTPEQRRVVEAPDGTTLVLAAVGSGKTTTLTARIAWLLDGPHALDPARVLALTFTNRAAEQMRRALAPVIGEARARQVGLTTFHARCAGILHRHARLAGLPADFRILDEVDATTLMRGCGESNPSRALAAFGSRAAADPEPTRARWAAAAFSHRASHRAYVRALRDLDAVDFSGLVYLARALLAEEPAVGEELAARYDAVLVDEVQDTHPAEYDVLRALARGARSFLLVGDLDQSIYGWRGARPAELVAALERDLPPVRRLHLTRNFRSTRPILELADRVAAGMGSRATRLDLTAPDGTPPSFRVYADEVVEAAAVADEVGACAAPPHACAVLVRSNAVARRFAEALRERALPVVTVEDLELFRQRDVKRVVAAASLVHDPLDASAAWRLVVLEDDGVDAMHDARPLGLRPVDLLAPGAGRRDDPFDGLFADEVVVLDTETTGLDPRRDEVIEVAAVRLAWSGDDWRVRDTFTRLVRNTVPLGGSEAVHGIDAATLAREGVPAARAFGELAEFVGRTPVAGHNLPYDLAMLRHHAWRVGRRLELARAFDTLDLSRRFLDLPDHRLATVAAALHVEVRPTHRALADVMATAGVAGRLRRRLAEPDLVRARRAWLSEHAPAFAHLRAALSSWREVPVRPADLVRDVVRSGVFEIDDFDAVERFVGIVAGLDDPDLPPDLAWRAVARRTVLSRGHELLDAHPGVRVFTLHQSKGLEFEAVWLPALVDGLLPVSWVQSSPEALEEERRLLYVGITRAARELHLSHARAGRPGGWGDRLPSRFLADAPWRPA